jgi:hypothetical protein
VNLTCGASCTYPILGLGALAAYSLFFAGRGHNFLHNTGIERIISENLFSDESSRSEEVDLADRVQEAYNRALYLERRREKEEKQRRNQFRNSKCQSVLTIKTVSVDFI